MHDPKGSQRVLNGETDIQREVAGNNRPSLVERWYGF